MAASTTTSSCNNGDEFAKRISGHAKQLNIKFEMNENEFRCLDHHCSHLFYNDAVAAKTFNDISMSDLLLNGRIEIFFMRKEMIIINFDLDESLKEFARNIIPSGVPKAFIVLCTVSNVDPDSKTIDEFISSIQKDYDELKHQIINDKIRCVTFYNSNEYEYQRKFNFLIGNCGEFKKNK